MKITNQKSASVILSKKERAPEIGHSEDRLYPDNRFRKEHEEKPHPAICTSCTAICFEKHWFIDPEQAKKLVNDKTLRHILCPGCQRIKEQIHDGEVVLESPIIKSNKDAVMGLIRHTEGKAWHDNPKSRIATIKDLSDRLEISTTTKWLATRIGKELYKAYKGELEIKKSPRENFVRIYWHRK